MIESELEEVFWDDFISWFEYTDNYIQIKSNFKKINFNNIKNEISELYLRRNLYVHADGAVNYHYLRAAPTEYTDKLKVGDRLKIDKEYILKKLNIVEKLGTMAFYAYSLKKFKGDTDEMFYIFNDLFLKFIKHSNNDIYSAIFDKFYRNKKLKNSLRITAKTNYFLCYKLTGDYNVIEREILSFDASGYSDEFIRAKNIIIGNKNSAQETIDFFDTIPDDEFLYNIQWPLYSVLKDYKEYVDQRLDDILS